MYKLCFSVSFAVFLSCISLIAKENTTQQQKNAANSKAVTNTNQSNIQTKPQGITKEDFQKQMQKLEDQRRKIQLKIYQLRVQLIREDPELLMMHNEIMKMHKKLATELNENEKMKGFLIQAQQLDTQIANLLKSKQENQENKDK